MLRNEKGTRVAKEKEERERMREQGGRRKTGIRAIVRRESGTVRVCVFRRGFVRDATRPPGSPSERKGEGKGAKRERKRVAGKGKVAGIRERLPHGPRLLQRKKIDMHDSRTRERAEGGWRGARGALLLGERKDRVRGRERGQRKSYDGRMKGVDVVAQRI